MIVREPIVAGQFYPARPGECRAQLSKILSHEPESAIGNRRLIGGLVPHAGWTYSGSIAGRVFRSLAASGAPDVVIIFGGVHRYRGREAALFAEGRWETPLGPVEVDGRLAERILGHTNLIADDPYAHELEHSIEVQMPFVKRIFPDARMVPIMVPARETAAEVGLSVARTLRTYGYNARVVGTTDLTHYGPHYGMVDHGVGAKGNTWAKAVNDQRFIDVVSRMQAVDVVPEALEHKNACSSGAVAAAVAAAVELGASEALLLEHTSSSEVNVGETETTPSDSVGYAGMVFVN